MISKFLFAIFDGPSFDETSSLLFITIFYLATGNYFAYMKLMGFASHSTGTVVLHTYLPLDMQTVNK